MCQCDLRKKWITFALDDDTYVEKIALDTKEYFSSTFRHLQILGSRKYPTDTWRVLGEIETDPTETQQWFDLSHTSRCAKCYVKYIKIRVLTSHTMEGYGICTLTRLQLFGGTLLQNLHRLQRKYEAPKHAAASIDASALIKSTSAMLESLSMSTSRPVDANPTEEQTLSAVETCPEKRDSHDELLKSPTVEVGKPSQGEDDESQSFNNRDAPSPPPLEAGIEAAISEGPPLLRFVEEMSALETNYHQLSAKVEELIGKIRERDKASLHNTQGVLDVGAHPYKTAAPHPHASPLYVSWASRWINDNGSFLRDVILAVAVISTLYSMYRINVSASRHNSSPSRWTPIGMREEVSDPGKRRWKSLSSDFIEILETASSSKLNEAIIEDEASRVPTRTVYLRSCSVCADTAPGG
ncbi:hypothetical protein Pmar_PMAR024374 [Perkinsus marinus ATCC 50983]|uniref:SUN domain-containing protein n=1 Tax=Perkinsus marinus (strain ATCC 50983 / TXsc) TaxID=423536 RepID=C5KLX2_PERM5|nr:hypothetical protein Pmar_PMAR024374 [Perkinsus marinus ATCC 50983]EER14487.1 hypothetical protein Pmar_PMAR024374 [Perkinsus marinus ATCC 50983]|eukprot:XP_002782692.1 hypothetical protein Pmar_PMAR024374 [Perkinsus marinus ATCC 50983]